MKIIEVKENKKQYLDLLLLADEQEDMHNMTEAFREFLHPKKESIKSMLVRNITKSQEKSAVESSTIIRHSKDSQCL